jgi:two-component system sensor histidine kinase UhpB
MQRIDPLTPGRRLETVGGDAEVVALTEAFNEMLDRLETERRESARRTLEAQEMERQRIARELHDEIGQTLTGLALRSETIARRAPREIRDELEDMREAARRGAEDVRTIARRLRPEALDELGLRSALMALTASVAEQSGLVVERSFSEDQELSGDQELVVYRVAQEGLTNAGAMTALAREHLQRTGPGSGADVTEVLTPREREIVKLVAEGQTSDEIATCSRSDARPSTATARTSSTSSAYATAWT